MQILGIQIDRPFVRAALVDRRRGRMDILCLKSPLLEEPGDVKQLYTPSFKGKITSGLSANDLLLRPLEIKTGHTRHLEQVLTFQSEVSYHFQSSEILSVPYLIKKGKEDTQALLFTASRDTIREHLKELKKIHIDPDLISAEPLALMHYIQWKFPSLFDAFIVDLGSDQWSCVWMEKGQLKKFHAIEGGVESLLSNLWEDRKKMIFQKEVRGIAKQIDLLQIKMHLNPHLFHRINQMRQELTKTIYSFHRNSGPRPVIFTGRVDSFEHIREYLMGGMKELISGEYSRDIPLEEQKYAIPIGLTLKHDTDNLQFRKEEFFPQKNWQRAGLYSLCLIIASLLFSIGLAAMGQYAMQSRKSEMIFSLKTSLNQWDPSLRKTIFSSLKEEDILDRWNKAVSTHAREYPYILQTPKVAEVLFWLYTHPLLEELRNEKDGIELSSFHYQLLQFPKLDAPRDPHQTKVELEFKTKSALNARKFHEALLNGDDYVDNSQEINWDASDNKYRVNFFIKNRSPHAL